MCDICGFPNYGCPELAEMPFDEMLEKSEQPTEAEVEEIESLINGVED